MRKVKICDVYPRSSNPDKHTKLHDAETNKEIICPLTSNVCTPDCVAYETNISANNKTKYACCYWHHLGNDEYLNIGELIEEAKP